MYTINNQPTNYPSDPHELIPITYVLDTHETLGTLLEMLMIQHLLCSFFGNGCLGESD